MKCICHMLSFVSRPACLYNHHNSYLYSNILREAETSETTQSSAGVTVSEGDIDYDPDCHGLKLSGHQWGALDASTCSNR